MTVSPRQRIILDILLREQEGITIGKIADEVEVSTRTVHRELHDLEDLLEKYSLQLVKKSGIGIQIQGDVEKKEELRLSLYNLTTLEFTPEERKKLIVCTLLESKDPVKLVSLAHDLKVTTATISHDLDEIDDWLRHFDLTLIRRRGYGVELEGPESGKRKIMSTLITENLSELELLGIVKENLQGKSLKNINSVSERLLGLIEKEKLIMVENALRNLDNDLSYPLADSAYIGLVIHLALAIERIEKGEKIIFDEAYLKELADTQEYRIAERILERIKSIFQIDVPVAEIGYITMHLRGAKLRNSSGEWIESHNVELMAKIKKLIEYTEEKLNVQLKDDESLPHGLLTHMEPAIFRIQRNMKIRNPLLEEIKNDYGELYGILREAVQKVFPQLNVPDEEVGYLTMHFGASIERTRHQNQKYRTLIVCSSGIGSSKILATRMKKEFSEIESLKNVSLFEIDHIPKNEYDLIVSTIPLPIHRNEYILVSPLLTKEDIQKIRLFIRSMKLSAFKKQKRTVMKEAHTDQVIQELQSMQSYLSHAIDLLKGFHFQEVNNVQQDLKDTLLSICEILHQKQVIRNKEIVLNQLLEREKLGGLGIPGTGLALFHSRNDEVIKVSFSTYSLKHPLFIRSMNDQEMEVNHILMLLGPKIITKEGLEVLSEISSLLIEEETVDVLKSKNEDSISDYFSAKLQEFTQNKMKERSQ
ncbi:transcription antiterminator [Ammoniphilus sp. 3BR4]|uniref:BglG family transcription antiterminator n=1 Tax=Ammoniphilus sp. 3BR4 TaxID=3158265 RepID=UPI00346756AF